MNNNLLSHLKQEHLEIIQLLEQLDKTTTKTAKTRENLFDLLGEKLLPHMDAEEDVFYPALQKSKVSTDNVLEALEEHHAVKMIFDELNNLPHEKENWGAKLRIFKEMIEHHIKEEEYKVFTNARDILNLKQSEEILQQFKQIEEKQMQMV